MLEGVNINGYQLIFETHLHIICASLRRYYPVQVMRVRTKCPVSANAPLACIQFYSGCVSCMPVSIPKYTHLFFLSIVKIIFYFPDLWYSGKNQRRREYV